MATIERFEDVQAWQKSRELTRIIYEITKLVKFRKDFSLVDQIRRAAISTMSNIAEGFARRTDKEFITFLSYSHGSVAELQSDLYVALDKSYISENQFNNVYKSSTEVSKLIQGFSNYLQKK